MKALAVFDWNGTLLDDTEAIISADNCTLEHFGGRAISTEVFKDTVFIPKQKFYILHGCGLAIKNGKSKAIADFAAAHYQQKLKNCLLRTGAVELLKYLKSHHVHVIVLSNDMTENIGVQLCKFGIDTYIDDILGNTDPHAFMEQALKGNKLAEYLKRTGPYSPQIILGDSAEEIIIGKKHNLTTISILGGIYSERRLVSEAPDFLLSELSEALDILQRIKDRIN